MDGGWCSLRTGRDGTGRKGKLALGPPDGRELPLLIYSRYLSRPSPHLRCSAVLFDGNPSAGQALRGENEPMRGC